MKNAVRSLALATCVVSLAGGLVVALGGAHPAQAAPCVRLSAAVFDAPGSDTTNLNGEWVRIKNYCTTAKYLSGWRIHDYGTKHTYVFPSGFKIGPGVSVTLYTGKGINTSTRRYWGRATAVWNNSPPEYAYLKDASGALVSKYTVY